MEEAPEIPVSHTYYDTGEEQDDTPVIKGINVNGDEYRLDYGSVKNTPVCLRKTAGSVILPATTVDFYENLPPA